jgi:Protein of unknown function (DUF3179)
VWSRRVDGRELHFRLAGLNNQNFLMFDEETGSWWQQISGECLLGPLKGKHLDRIYSDEVTLETWRSEHPDSMVARFQNKSRDEYVSSDWEKDVGKLPVTVAADPSSPAAARDLIVGIEVNGKAVAYPLSLLRDQSPVNTMAGGRPVLVVVGADGKSVRTFFRDVDGRALEFFRKPAGELTLIDAETGSFWDFSGRSTGGPLKGRILDRIQNITEYWFDWKRYNPATTLYRAGESIRKNRSVSPHM